MQRCLFIGGPIDGERREADTSRATIVVPGLVYGSMYDHGAFDDPRAAAPMPTATYERGEITDAFGKRHVVYYHRAVMTAERCVVHELLAGYVGAQDRELILLAKRAGLATDKR